MYKKISYIAAVLMVFTGISVNAQITTQSPYSRFGIGNIKGMLLPQFRAMGGISTAVFRTSGYFNTINVQNPASYSGINLTTIDIGMSAGFSQLKKDGASESSFNSTLSHIALAFPVSSRSALSFGVLPYSELGYQYKNQVTLTSPLDPSNTSSENANYIYSGEGGLTKAYIGYGYQFGSHFRIGGNAEYLFGNLLQSSSTEFDDINSINSRLQTKNSIGGFSFSYGAQYEIPLGNKTSVTFGYSGSSASSVNSKRTFVATQYLKDQTGNEMPALDTVQLTENGNSKLKLPLIHNFGIVLQKNNKWLVGVDYRMGKWSDLTINNQNQDLQDTHGFSVGGQLTPDITSIGSYFNRVDYRLGFQYDKTYISLNNQDIKQMGISFGLGLPLAPPTDMQAIYKLNFTAEFGKRGTMNNGLLQENYLNLHLGFTINDKWFNKYKFD